MMAAPGTKLSSRLAESPSRRPALGIFLVPSCKLNRELIKRVKSPFYPSPCEHLNFLIVLRVFFLLHELRSSDRCMRRVVRIARDFVTNARPDSALDK